MKRTLTTLAVGLAAAVLLTALPLRVFAQDDTGGSGGGSVEAADSTIDADRKPVLDPFKVLIVPKKPVAPPVVHTPVVRSNPGPPPIPPLQVSLTAIAGEDPDFVAVIQYKGSDYIVEKGWEAPDKSFLVRTIYADKVEVFYNKDKSVKTFFYQP